ncbi:MFS general substrate transporter [Trichodelitschia bisporula]|uniref:MFS general substrate transporter n=1 Tax=Trichodelitschia bisporula TaxID=703511 RepID=A0A6G1HS08_9PEZI|nr:MFS general substrate transporter [Trichodelitschia bisporula]
MTLIPRPRSPPAGPDRAALVDLAAAEGHDADIPSNIGRVPDEKTPHSLTPDTPVSTGPHGLDKDLEKEAGSAQSSASSVAEPEPTDPNIVDWDGPDDPANPQNWSTLRKTGAILIISGFTFLIPLGSSIFAPGVPLVMEEFHSHNTLLAGFVVSVYVLGFAFGPLVIAPLSEMHGRLPLYHASNALFTIFTIACALAPSLNSLIAFRFIAGAVGAAPLALGGGTIADVTTREQRATAMSVWMLGPTVGPVLGPIAGGFISAGLGWRWNFWVVAIAAGAFGVGGLVLMRETYAPAILAKKAARLRKETGNSALRSKLDSGLAPRDLFLFSIVRPTKMLFLSPIVFFLSAYVALVYSYLYLMFTTFTDIFLTQYHFAPRLVGLSFVGIGIGAFVGQFGYSWLANRDVRKHIAAGTFTPERRLVFMCPGAFLVPIGLFWYGWAVQARVHWICPIMATVVFGVGLLLIFMPANTYLVDVYTVHAASAMAANTVLRSIAAAILPLAGPSMFKALGYGGGGSLLGGFAVVMLPVPFIFLKYGERLRTRFVVKL